jgi:hypothetical protein
VDGAAHRAMDAEHGGVGVAIADFDNNGQLDSSWRTTVRTSAS